jgi:hypothetical protein
MRETSINLVITLHTATVVNIEFLCWYLEQAYLSLSIPFHGEISIEVLI